MNQTIAHLADRVHVESQWGRYVAHPGRDRRPDWLRVVCGRGRAAVGGVCPAWGEQVGGALRVYYVRCRHTQRFESGSAHCSFGSAQPDRL